MAPHVLIVPTEHYVTARYPLGGIFQYQQAVALHRAGFTVGVIGAGVITPRFLLRSYPYERFERATGFPVYRRYVRRLMPHRWWSAPRAIKLYRKLGLQLYAKYVRDHGRPDVIHAHNIRYAGFIAEAIREKYGVPFVITEHSSEWKTGADAAVIESIRRVAGHSAQTTGVTRALATWIEKELSTTGIGVLPNIVDSAFLEFPLAPRTIITGAPRFLSVGLLTENKNHASLIKAFAARFAGSLATLRIGGSGPERGNLERLVAKLDIGAQVKFLGHLSRANVLAEMQAANCFVLSSRYETFGVVLIEAMATGLPVISTRSQGPEELVNETNGLLVDRDDTLALGAAMTQMSERLSTYSPTRLREDCRARFGPDAFVKRAGDLYASAIKVSSAEG